MTLLFGVLLTFGSAWFGLVFAPFVQLGNLQAVKVEGSSDVYPQPLQGIAAQGLNVYKSQGCIYCHSQQIRPEFVGSGEDRYPFVSDIKRGWGPRRTLPQDYIYDRPVMLGTMRTGPDLANIGTRQQASWHHIHLYNPRITSPGSIMPPFAHLYEVKQVVGRPSPRAIQDLPGADPKREHLDLQPGTEIIPTAEAEALVAYLLAQDRTKTLEGVEP